jgi:hypothetical protein
MEPPVLWCLLYVRSSRHRYLDRTRHAVRSGLKRHLALGLLTYTNSIHFSRPNSYFPSQILLDLVAMSREFSNCMESVPRFMQRNFLIRKCGAGSVSPFIISINVRTSSGEIRVEYAQVRYTRSLRAEFSGWTNFLISGTVDQKYIGVWVSPLSQPN